jgi:ABC-2 type transport system ATP-binding protein
MLLEDSVSPHIVVRDLRKVYRVPQREPGLRAALRSVFRRQYVDCLAVDDVNFTVQPGEILGFIGPNGAGKTTTLKMLCGLLYPTSGEARVDGHVPWERRTEFLRRISMVMGNRHQLAWENTVNDSFHLLAEIYNVPRGQFADTRGELVDLLELEDLLPKMVRDLSLGERMKCELAAALLHRPTVLFLDEPTLGLDVSMQFRLRQYIARYNHQTGATVILTSHYMADVVTLCPRVILIHQGRLLFDGQLSRLAEQMAPFKLIRADLGDGAGDAVAGLLSELGPGVTLVAQDDRKLTLRVRRREASHVTARLLRDIAVVDLSVEDPPIEAVIDQVYRERAES